MILPPPLPPRNEEKASVRNFEEARRLLEARKFLDLASRAGRQLDIPRIPPHQVLQWVAIKAYALIRVREFKQAADQIQAIGGLDNPRHTFEAHPEVYGMKHRGSMVPFSLRLMDVILPFIQPQPEGPSPPGSVLTTSTAKPPPPPGAAVAINRAYKLLASVKKSYQTASSVVRQNVAMSKIIFVSHLLAELHASEAQYLEAIETLQDVIQSQPQHQPTLSLLGRITLAMGAIGSAEEYFGLAECVAADASLAATQSNSGFLAVARTDFPAARQNFENSVAAYSETRFTPQEVTSSSAIASVAAGGSSANRDDAPGGTVSLKSKPYLRTFPAPVCVATNNLAVAHLYCSNLFEATVHLENVIMKETKSGACLDGVRNLSMLYEFPPDKPQCLLYLRESLMDPTEGVPQDEEIKGALRAIGA